MELDVDLDAMINPHFDAAFFADALNIALEGGRGSTKSSAISVELVSRFLDDPDANALIMRKVANTLELSVYEQIKWAIYQIGVEGQFKFLKSPYRILHVMTNTAFYFAGVDDPQKLKSMIIARGYVRWLWFEELSEFKDWAEIDTVRLSFTRKRLPAGMHVLTFYSWNPPRNPYEWIVDWEASRRSMPGWFVDHSTYLDDTLHFLSDDYIAEIEAVKDRDPDYYRWQYLGESVGLGTNVYNISLFNQVPAVQPDDEIMALAFSTDPGHSQSATAVSGYGFSAKGNVYVLDTYYYSPAHQVNKKPPSELASDMHDFVLRISKEYHAPIVQKTIDSADGAIRNQYSHDFHDTWHPVAKAKEVDMIDVAQDLLAHGRVFVLNTDGNKVFMKQHEMYRWDEKTIGSADPHVVKENDHTCDEFKYMCLDNRRRLGLKR